MDKILISIIIPCYNQGQFLPETLNSLLAQTCTSWECIMVNDGSTDNTKEVAQSFCVKDNRFIYLEVPNGGPSAARNVALRMAKGIFIQFLDSDDILATNKLQFQLDAINEYGKEAASNIIFYSSARYFTDNEPDARTVFKFGSNNLIAQFELTYDEANQERAVLIRNPLVISSSFYPRGLFDAIGLFDESLQTFEDYDLHIRAIFSGYKFHYIGYHSDAIVLIRLHPKSLSRQPKPMEDGDKKLWEKHTKNSPKIALLKHQLDKELNGESSITKNIVRAITPPFIWDAVRLILRKSNA